MCSIYTHVSKTEFYCQDTRVFLNGQIIPPEEQVFGKRRGERCWKEHTIISCNYVMNKSLCLNWSKINEDFRGKKINKLLECSKKTWESQQSELM